MRKHLGQRAKGRTGSPHPVRPVADCQPVFRGKIDIFIFTASCLEPAREIRVAPATQQATPRGVSLPGLVEVEQGKLRARHLMVMPERLVPEVRAWRLDRPVPVFFVPVRPLSIRSRAQSAHEPRLCSCRSSRTWLELCWPHRASFSKHPRVFLRASLRNRFHAARAQSQPARLLRKARKGARSRAMWTRARANGQPGEEIPARPFQFVNLRDSIKRGSRIGKSEVLGTICR